MKIFASRCHTFEYTVTTASPAAVDLESAAIGVSKADVLDGEWEQRGDHLPM